MAVNKEKQQNSLDLLLQTDLKPKQSDLDAMPRVLEFQKVILKKTPVVSTFPSSVNSAQSAVDLHNSLPTTRSIEAISGPDEGNLLSSKFVELFFIINTTHHDDYDD